MAAYREFKQAPQDASTLQKLGVWVDNRFPTLGQAYRKHMSEYYAPKNFNWWYVFGSLALLVLGIQIVTGIFLVMNYKPDAATAFASVEYIMREVPGGWLIRYMHSTGASAFFVVVYLHMFRGMLYGSYRSPRELVWLFGCAIFLVLMAEAFMGYLLPWGQMSYWGAQVIINLFSAIPIIGPDLSLYIRGDYVVGDATLNRFFSFHVIAVPLALIGLVLAHLLALHDVGSNNPDGVEINAPEAPKNAQGHPLDGIAFHPYYTVHDIFAVSLFLLVFFAIIFFAPEMGGYFLEYNNFIPADPFTTPTHIAPVWYFTPFYSMLRATTDNLMIVFSFIVVVAGYLTGRCCSKRRWLPLAAALAIAIFLFGIVKLLLGKAGVSLPAALLLPLGGLDPKFWGVVVMGASVLILFFLPWLDKSPVKSIRYRPNWHLWIYIGFVIWFLVLGYLGIKAPSTVGTIISQIGTLMYFGFFLLMPWWSRMGTFRTPPTRVTFTPH